MSVPDDDDGRPRPYPRPRSQAAAGGTAEQNEEDVLPQDDREGPAPFEIPPLEPIDPLPYPQLIAPPGWLKCQAYSLWFFLFVMASITGFTWWAWFAIGSPAPLLRVTIIITLVAAGFCLLRLVRGSVLEAEKRFEETLRDKATAATTTSKGGFPVLARVGNRVGMCLDRTPGKPPERVLWEGKQDWPVVFSVAARRFTKNDRRRKASKWFFGIFIFLIAASIFYSRQGDPAGVVSRLNGLIGILSLVPAAYIAYGVWEWQVNRYAITSKRLMGVTGIVRKDVGSMPNNRFTDAKISISVTARLFEWLRIVNLAWATWDVESAGQDQALKIIRFVPAGHIVGPFFSLGDTQ